MENHHRHSEFSHEKWWFSHEGTLSKSSHFSRDEASNSWDSRRGSCDCQRDRLPKGWGLGSLGSWAEFASFLRFLWVIYLYNIYYIILYYIIYITYLHINIYIYIYTYMHIHIIDVDTCPINMGLTATGLACGAGGRASWQLVIWWLPGNGTVLLWKITI